MRRLVADIEAIKQHLGIVWRYLRWSRIWSSAARAQASRRA
jgi:hypothetical protein